MKKRFALVGFVILTFMLYSVHERQAASKTVVATMPSKPSTKSSTTNTTPKTVTSTPTTSPSAGSSTPQTTTTSGLKDGQYVGATEDAFYGSVQVQATIQGGKLTDVEFLQYPNSEPNSIQINMQAMPTLKQEAIQAQSANVDAVSGATNTSQAFTQSLASALTKAEL